MMDYLVRFAQFHLNFRLEELKALAALYEVELEIIHYSEYSPFAIVRLPAGGDIRLIVSRAILIQSVYELWGEGSDYASLHASVRSTAAAEIRKYLTASFKFKFDSFQGSNSMDVQRKIINDFSWLGFQGPIVLTNPDAQFVIFEEYESTNDLPRDQQTAVRKGEMHVNPLRVYLGRWIGSSGRDLITTYSLKKRKYLNTTTMDAEVALITANMAKARPGALFLDPFIGTGSLTVACAHFGATVLGSDIDPRALRGKGGIDLRSNYHQYGTAGRDLGSVISDLVNSPFRGWSGLDVSKQGVHKAEWVDGIVCDPPYGIREGLKTLGKRNNDNKTIHYASDGLASYLHPDYFAPRKPYSFTAILEDLLSFAAAVLVPNGRLSFWMPTADDVEETLEIPMHRKLELISVCVQPFNKWSRRLITYRKRHLESCPPSPLTSLAGEAMGKSDVLETERVQDVNVTAAISATGTAADDLNPFRKRYFQGFRTVAERAGVAVGNNADDKDAELAAQKSELES